MFDVDAFQAAHLPWSFTLGGRTFGAKHVSAPRVAKYERKLNDAAALFAKSPLRANLARYTALRWLLRCAFPWRIDYLWRGDPVRLLIHLPPAARTEALKDFFACLQGISNVTPVTLPPPNPPIPGTSLPVPTPPRSP